MSDDAERIVPVVIHGQRYPVRSALQSAGIDYESADMSFLPQLKAVPGLWIGVISAVAIPSSIIATR